MKVLIITPSYPPDITGNAITAQRLYSGLLDQGIEVRVLTIGAKDIYREVKSFRPDLIHALHAKKSGSLAVDLSGQFRIPFVVTITGTDLNIDLFQLDSEEVVTALESARAVIVYSDLTRIRLSSRLPSISGKIIVIRPSIEFKSPCPDEPSFSEGVNFLLPSGIRKVKDPTFAIEPFEVLKKEFPAINLTVAGPVLEESEWSLFSKRSEGKDWIRHMEVSHDCMAGLYKGADVILNTSSSEGFANAILEAMYFGKPILASDCEGNRAAITDGKEGVLYRTGDMGDFLNKARMLINDPALRLKLGKVAREKVSREYSLDREIKEHRKLYEGLRLS